MKYVCIAALCSRESKLLERNGKRVEKVFEENRFIVKRKMCASINSYALRKTQQQQIIVTKQAY